MDDFRAGMGNHSWVKVPQGMPGPRQLSSARPLNQVSECPKRVSEPVRNMCPNDSEIRAEHRTSLGRFRRAVIKNRKHGCLVMIFLVW